MTWLLNCSSCGTKGATGQWGLVGGGGCIPVTGSRDTITWTGLHALVVTPWFGTLSAAVPTEGREQQVLITSWARLPDPSQARGLRAHMSRALKAPLDANYPMGSLGRERSSIIAKLAPDCEINIETVSPSKLLHQRGCLGRGTALSSAILCERHERPGDSVCGIHG